MRAHRDLELQAWLGRAADGLRATPTWSEQLLFRHLSRSELGVRFVRQAVLGRHWVVDLLAPKARLVVEIDGLYHQRRAGADARRERKLRRLGYRVLRLQAGLVERDVAQAVELIKAALRAAA
jgi:very-short-patch-repair endonuclease